MKIYYTFYNREDVYSAEFDDAPNILWGLVSYRNDDARDWEWLLEDINFIQNNQNNLPIVIEGQYYHGKTDRLEQLEIEGYRLWIDSSVCSVSNDTKIYSNKDYTKIMQKHEGEPAICCISTKSFSNLIEKWQNFLILGKEEERGEIEIDFMDLPNASWTVI